MELISYALDFASFIIQSLKNKEKNNIYQIILFGSVARGDFNKNSDVDIFVDCNVSSKLDASIQEIKNKFFESKKYKDYWLLFGIKNEINVVVGNLDKWKLKNSLIGSSIVLYGPYNLKNKEGKNKVLLSWGKIKSESQRVMLNKRILGYSHYGKKYAGKADLNKFEKLGTNVLLIEADSLKMFLKIFYDLKIAVSLRNVFEYDH